jgi:hypothetical protein
MVSSRLLGYGSAALLLVLILNPNKWLLTVMLLGLTWYYSKEHPDKRNVSIVISTGLLFVMAEMFAIQYGLWTYRSPDINGVPIWLFPLWGITGLILYHRGRK